MFKSVQGLDKIGISVYKTHEKWLILIRSEQKALRQTVSVFLTSFPDYFDPLFTVIPLSDL